MRREEYLTELIKSKEIGEFTEALESGCNELISKWYEKYNFKKTGWVNESLMKEKALSDCKRYSLGFKPERSDNAFAYLTQNIRCSFARTYGKLYKEEKNKVS